MWYEPAADWSEIDRALGLPTDDQLRALARRIDALHRDQRDASASWRTTEHRLIGLWGERHLARCFRLPMDTTLQRWGNRRRNFVLADGTVVDVITRTPLKSGQYPDLTLAANRTGRVDAVVLVIFHGYAFEPEIAGWIDEPTLRAAGERRAFRDGFENLVWPVSRLRPFWELLARHRPDDPLAQPPAASEPVVAPEPRPTVVQASLW